MNKKNILYWFIGWAGMFVAVLYSPMGSPDLYSNSSSYVVTENVSFDNVVFSKKGPSGSGVQDNSPQLMSGSSLSASQAPMVQSVPSTIRGYGSAGVSSSNSKESTRPSMGTSGMGVSSGSVSSSAANSGNIAESRVASTGAINPDLNDPMVRQAATNDGSGILQPDLDGDNPGQMIPVGDNLAILMMMLGIYAIFRFRRVVNV